MTTSISSEARRNQTSILIRGRGNHVSPKPDRQTNGRTDIRTGGHQYLQNSFATKNRDHRQNLKLWVSQYFHMHLTNDGLFKVRLCKVQRVFCRVRKLPPKGQSPLRGQKQEESYSEHTTKNATSDSINDPKQIIFFCHIHSN